MAFRVHPPQADALAAMLAEMDGHVKSVPYICVPDAILIERLSWALDLP